MVPLSKSGLVFWRARVRIPPSPPVSLTADMKKELKTTSDELSLRAYLPSDVDCIYEAVQESINELSPRMWWCHPDYSRKEVETWTVSQTETQKKEKEYNFAIIDTKEDMNYRYSP
jgi:hypothetical protein